MKDHHMARYCHNCILLERVSLSRMENSKLVSAYELNFLNLLQKSIFCQIYNKEIL